MNNKSNGKSRFRGRTASLQRARVGQTLRPTDAALQGSLERALAWTGHTVSNGLVSGDRPCYDCIFYEEHEDHR
jgi:hypothetical protein